MRERLSEPWKSSRQFLDGIHFWKHLSKPHNLIFPKIRLYVTGNSMLA